MNIFLCHALTKGLQSTIFHFNDMKMMCITRKIFRKGYFDHVCSEYMFRFMEMVSENMKVFIRVMKALSDPNRVKIMKMLQARPLCVCEIKEALGIAQSTASKHLKILEEADLVRSFKDGLWVNYSLSDGNSSPYSASMIGNLKHWLDNESEIKELHRIVPGIDRHDIIGKKQA